jgi:large subunit ribosomal protein L32e
MSKEFKRRDTSKLKRLGDKWRRPKSRRNWMRLKTRGKPPIVQVGYRTPKEERYKINNKVPIRVFSLNDLENVNKEKNIVIIGGTVGKKKRAEILKACAEKGIEVYNP